MYEFTSSEIEQMFISLNECLADATCLDAWVDSLEYDVKNYIGEKPFSAFRGFTRSLIGHINHMKGICFSKESFLDL